MTYPSIKQPDELKKLQDRIAQFSLAIGIDIFNPHPKPSKRVLASTVVSLLWQVLVWHTIIKDLPSLNTLSLAYVHISFFSQGLSRTVNLIINPFTTANLQSSILNFYRHHENDYDVRVILVHAIKRIKKLAYGIITFDCVIFNSGIVLLIVFIFTGAYVLLVPIYLPYLNANELVGYLLNLSLQLALGAVGFFTFATYDAAIIIYGYHSMTFVEVLKLKMRKLQVQMNVNDLNRKKSDKKKFIDIIELYSQLNRYNCEFSNLIRIPFATAVIVNIIGIFLCINIGLKQSLSLSIGASLGLFFQLLLPLIVAVMQSFQKYQLLQEVNAFLWNRFKDTCSQKNYCCLISIVQHDRGIILPIFGTLNMSLILRLLAVSLYFVIQIASIYLCST